MNREYAKFDEPEHEYVPAITRPGHFSNFPDLLIPSDYQEVEGDPLEKEIHELIRSAKTPPPTPPEEEPGRAGFNLFHEKIHYLAPIFQDEAYRRKFSTTIIIGNMLSYIPCLIFNIVIASSREVVKALVSNSTILYLVFVFSGLGTFAYLYFVSLFRNYPFLQLATAARSFLAMTIVGSTALVCHGFFVKILVYNAASATESHENRTYKQEVAVELLESNHSTPYFALLMMLLLCAIKACVLFVVQRLHLSVTNYFIPFVIYTMSFSTSSFLVTIALNNAFKKEPISYDVFQIILGCLLASMLAMRTAHFIDRLYKGKVCPLKEGESLYAMNHFGR